MGNLHASTNDTVQALTNRTKTASAALFVAPAAAGLAATAASGWQKVGVADSLNFNSNELGIIDVMTGNPGTSKEKHAGTSSATFDITLKEVQPVCKDLVNKTTLDHLAVAAATGFTTATIAVGGAGLSVLAVDDVTDLKVGHLLKIPLATDVPGAAFFDYRFVELVNAADDEITLAHPLSELPEEGATVTRIESIGKKNGGKTLKNWAALMVASMNDNTVNAIKIPNFNVTGGQVQFNDPQSDIIKSQIAGGINAVSQTINGVREPILSEETEYMPVIA